MVVLSESDVRLVADGRYWKTHWKVWLVWLLGCMLGSICLGFVNQHLGLVLGAGLFPWLIWWLRGMRKAEDALVAEWKKD